MIGSKTVVTAVLFQTVKTVFSSSAKI